MPRKTAGARYPHASSTARIHDHQWCPVIGTVAERVAAGAEQWGVPHPLPVLPTEAQALRIRQGLFRGRDCAKLKAKHGQLSVSVMFQAPDGTLSNTAVPAGGGYRLVVRVWDRKTAKREITRRVKDGEPLPYNVLREKL
jgi:hypothetical protein